MNAPTLDVVSRGVVDQISNEGFDQSGVAVEGGRAEDGLDMQPQAFAVSGRARRDGAADVRQVGSILLFHIVLAAGEGQEGFDEGFLLPVGGEKLLSGGSPEVGSGRVVQCELD